MITGQIRKRERVTGRALGWKQSITEHLEMFKVAKSPKSVKAKKKSLPLLDGSTHTYPETEKTV